MDLAEGCALIWLLAFGFQEKITTNFNHVAEGGLNNLAIQK
jgi:hypothetical protein